MMEANHSADTEAVPGADMRERLVAPDTRILVDHTVMFHLGDADQFVVPRRGAKGFVRVDGVTVHLLAKGDPRVWGGGTICKKDGTFSEHWGRTNVSVDLPNPAQWVWRAEAALAGEPPA